ncbi:MAG TPA: hypothetical protein VG819_13295 [Rhizomicrobium sp.]|jgi:hypothetical protein|nr:hypothetical protein [Rhizomicrobium sp.]
MKSLKNLALGALMLAGTAVGVSAPANAGVHVGIGIGIPGPVYYGPAYACDPYYDYYDPYGCGAYYTGPVFIDGVWVREPLRWRWWHGHRQFWWRGGWRAGTHWRSGGFHGRGFHPAMHNSFRGGFHGRPALHSGFRGGPSTHFGYHGGFRGGPGLHSGPRGGFHGSPGMHSGPRGSSHGGGHGFRH